MKKHKSLLSTSFSSHFLPVLRLSWPPVIRPLLWIIEPSSVTAGKSRLSVYARTTDCREGKTARTFDFLALLVGYVFRNIHVVADERVSASKEHSSLHVRLKLDNVDGQPRSSCIVPEFVVDWLWRDCIERQECCRSRLLVFQILETRPYACQRVTFSGQAGDKSSSP